ncbi:MAG: FAD-dependent oxidoreductase [Polyangiaceae bacterium]
MSTDVERAGIVIVGAGLAGLAASGELRRAGVPHRVLEASDAPGGLGRTVEEVGYRFDRTGHLLHVRDPELRAELLALCGPHSLLELERRAMVFSRGVMTRYPYQSNVDGLPPEVKYECVLGFLRAQAGKPVARARTFEEFCLQHFGEAICREFMIPYNEKVWGVHPRELSAVWCERFVPIPTVEDVLRGAFGVAGPPLGYNARFLYPRVGTGALTQALASRATVLETGTPVERVDYRARRVRANGVWLPYSALASTMPLDRLVALLDDPPSEIQRASAALRSVPVHYLDIALNTPCLADWHWVYVPEARYPFYRVGAYSNFSAAMAPPGKAALWVELSSRSAPDVPTLLPIVGDALVEMGAIRSREAIRFARARKIDPAYVIYDEAREVAVPLLLAWLREQGIWSFGRYGAWEYSSMQDAILSGRAAARELLAVSAP